LAYEPTHLDGLVEQLVQVILPTAEARSLKITMTLDTQQAYFAVHADSIAQVVRNLLRNAVQYADHGGTLKVQTTSNGGIFRFTCTNSGPCIEPHDLPFVFKRFYRSEGARHRGTGVGIGLAIAKELVETHGGQIGIESQEGWTTVLFEIPCRLTARQQAG
jgi:two-component system sensor histidine kinase BaeS